MPRGWAGDTRKFRIKEGFKSSNYHHKIRNLTFPVLASPQSKRRDYMRFYGDWGGRENLCRSRWKENKCPKFLFVGRISLDEVSFKMHVEKFLKIPWLYLASLWHRRIHQRLFQTVTFPQPSFQFNISSKTNAKISTILPTS